MIGLSSTDTHYAYRRYGPTGPRKLKRRYIVREWSAEEYDLPVLEWRRSKQVELAPELCITIISREWNCYAARAWFLTEPVNDDEWASAALKVVRKRNSKRGCR